MADVPWTFPKCPIIWSLGRPPTGSRRRPHLELLNICFSSKNQWWMCKTKTIASKKHFFHQILNFSVGPLKIFWRSQTLGPLGELQGTSPGRRVKAGIIVSRLGSKYASALTWRLSKPFVCLKHFNSVNLSNMMLNI